MKKILLLSACGLLLGIFQNTLWAQSRMDRTNGGIGAGYDFTPVTARVNQASAAAAKNLEKVNKKTMRQFVGWYKDTRDENWYHVNSGIVVKFEENGLEKMAAFNTKGYWLFTIIYLDENKIPARIRWLVRSRFYDYKIAEIEQIESPSSNIYLVHMQNDSSWMNLRIHNEEIKIMEDFTKN